MGHPDFRVRGTIIASLGYPGRGWAVVCLKPDQQRRFVRAEPEIFVPVKGGWGRAGNTNVRLAAARTAVVREALLAAWWIRAPKRCWMELPAGDVVLLPHGAAHALADKARGRVKPLEQMPLEEIGDRTY